MKEQFEPLPQKRHRKTFAFIELANELLTEAQEAGIQSLAIRALYYMARGRNDLSAKEGEAFERAIGRGREWGLIDWDAISDSVRDRKSLTHWANPSEIVRAAADSFHKNRWRGQKVMPEVWIEKRTLIDVVAPVCEDLDVPYLVTVGFGSKTVLYDLAQRFQRAANDGQPVVLLYLGDHDPSGLVIDETLAASVAKYTREEVDLDIRRVALTLRQARDLDLPAEETNPKNTCSRAYMRRFGNEQWEIDALVALHRGMIEELLREEIESLIDFEIREQVDHEIEASRELLRTTASDFDLAHGG